MLVRVDGLAAADARRLSHAAARRARQLAPRLSGEGARSITPHHGPGFFGVRWAAEHLWHQEMGTARRTMTQLAGKTIPMWVDDPTGRLSRGDPKARSRVVSGRRQVLVFRRAAPVGQTKLVGQPGRMTRVPAAYPGARTPAGDKGQGPRPSGHRRSPVRWRHPGITGRSFLGRALRETARDAGVPSPEVYVEGG